MSALLLSPHNDDESIFTAFTLLRHQPHVIVCFWGQVQDSPHYPGGPISGETRRDETAAAMDVLECEWTQYPYADTATDVTGIRHLLELRARVDDPKLVFAPAVEEGGHEQHNAIGQLALEVFGDRVQPYLTYRRGHGRSKGTEVPFEPHWPALKMRALACYESQIACPATSTWFIDEPIREYVP